MFLGWGGGEREGEREQSVLKLDHGLTEPRNVAEFPCRVEMVSINSKLQFQKIIRWQDYPVGSSSRFLLSQAAG